MPSSRADRAVLACCLELAASPKPGNVDRRRDHADLTFETMLAGALGARPGLRAAAAGEPIGPSFERGVRGMAAAAGQNTHVGTLLLLVPLVRAAGRSPLADGIDPAALETTTDDAAAFYRAFDVVDVAVDDPPPGAADLDVRRGAAAIEALEERGLTLSDVMALSASRDGVAREWTTGFERSFRAAAAIEAAGGPDGDAIAEAYLAALADRPDTLVETRHGEAVATSVSERASRLVAAGGVDGAREAVETFADELVERGINPGTTADITAAGAFISLERGVEDT